MCLILLGYKVSKKYPLILAANRDEFFHRPTAPMHFWEDNNSILAGKDLEQGGTWFGVNKYGTFAALTNYRDPASLKQKAPSRGEIVIDFLTSKKFPKDYHADLKNRLNLYNGFNLILGNNEELFWFSNVKNQIEKIKPGIHGLSNGFLNTPWPKVTSGKKTLKQIIAKNITIHSLFSLLSDRSMPDDVQLPHTGVGIEWERTLSPLFIQSKIYGTRSSTIMLINQNGSIGVTERTYNHENDLTYLDRHFPIGS